MSRYIVRIVGPAGHETYLSLGREVSRDNATRYPHPSNAWRAAVNYATRNYSPTRRRFVYDVIDTRDPERQVPG